MKLIAKKPCSFGGVKFYIGDEIPAEYVIDPAGQETMGVLTCITEDGATTQAEEIGPRTIEVGIKTKEGVLPLTVTEDGLQAIFDVLTGTVPEAEETIGKITDGDALILLHLSDSRKSVREAAEERAKAINDKGEERAGDQ